MTKIAASLVEGGRPFLLEVVVDYASNLGLKMVSTVFVKSQ